MKTKNIIAIFAIVMMIAIFVPQVSASLVVNKASNEFSLQSTYQEDFKVCQCGGRTDVFEINNHGDFDAIYKVEVFSPHAEYMSISEETFFLEAKCQEPKKVYVYIEAPCDEPIDTFYTLKVSTDYGRSKEITKRVYSKHCQNIKCVSEIENKEILPGDVITQTIDIQNVAGFTDNFKISSPDCEDVTVLNPDELRLEGDEEATVTAKIQFPYSEYGKKSCPIVVETEKNKERVVCEYTDFEIKEDYDYTIKTQNLEIKSCEDITTRSKLTIENLADTPNIYYLHLAGPDFVRLSQTELDLREKEKDSVDLIIEPTQANVGEYELILSSTTAYGDKEKTKVIKLTVNDCFGMQTSLDGQGQITDRQCTTQCSDSTGCDKPKEYVLNIRNDGIYEEAFEIEIDGPSWIETQEQFVRLRTGQNKDIKVVVDYPNVDTTENAFVRIKQLRAPGLVQEIPMTLESLSKRSCYNVDLVKDNYDINYETENIPVLVQNTGLKGGVYALELEDLDSRFVQLKEKEITLEAGETKVLHLMTEDYSDYEKGRYLNELDMKISLVEEGENCCSGNELTYEKQFWINLKDKGLFASIADYLKGINYSKIGFCGAVGIVLLLIAIILLIVMIIGKANKGFKTKRIKVDNAKKLRVTNAVMIGLIIIGIISLFLLGSPDMSGYYEKARVEGDSMNHVWKQNSEYQIDLQQYFVDPDFDALSFTASQPDHIQVLIEEDTATLLPEYGWSGSEKIVFTASDGNGGITDSPIMTLNVVKKKPVGVLDYWNLFCKHINIVLLIAILLIAIFIVDSIEFHGYRKYLPKDKR
jgi:hypothetical protein